MFDLYQVILPVGRTFVATAPMDKGGASAWADVLGSVVRSAKYVAEHFDELHMLQSGWSVEAATDWIYSRITFDTWHLLVHEIGWTRDLAVRRTVESLESDLLIFSTSD